MSRDLSFAFGQNIPAHPEVPRGSRWRNKRSGRSLYVVGSSAEAVMTTDEQQRRRVMVIDRFLRFHDRVVA